MLRTLLVFVLGLSGSVASAQDRYRPDDKVPDALAAQVTEAGFNAIEQAAIDLAPALLAEGAIELPELDFGDDGTGIALTNLADPRIEILALDIEPYVDSMSLAGADLRITGRIALGLNSAQNPYDLRVSAFDLGFIDWDPCQGPGYLNRLVIRLDGIKVHIEVRDGAFEVDLGNFQNRLALQNPQFEGECGGLLNFIVSAGGDIAVDLIAAPLLAPTLTDLEATLEDALAAAAINLTGEDAIELLGKQLNVELTPDQAYSSPDGLKLQYDARFTAAQDPCVADIDPLSSPKTRSNTTTGTPEQVPGPGQILAHVSDDMVNQALYAAFSGGFLCIDVDEELLGDAASFIPQGAQLISFLAGEDIAADFEPFLDEGSPVLLRVEPLSERSVPEAWWGDPAAGDKPINIEVEDLGLSVYTGVEGRTARIIGIDIDASVGVDVVLEEELVDGVNTGKLAIDLGDLGSDALTFSFGGDEFVAGTGPDIAANVGQRFGGLIPTIVGGLAGDSLAFELPSIEGYGLSALMAAPHTPLSDWLEVGLSIGPVDYGAAGGGLGCDGEGGGCGGGCGDGGCDQGGVGPLPMLLFFAPLWALRRRRR